MNDVEFLRNYKIQNPIKYAQKYGDRTPEEAAPLLQHNQPFLTGAIKVEVSDVKEVEAEFKAPVELSHGFLSESGEIEVQVVEEAPAPEKPKKRKAK